MKKFLLLLIPLLFVGCALQPSDTSIEIKFTGTRVTNITNAAKQHPIRATCKIRTSTDCPKLTVYYRHDDQEDWQIGTTSENATKLSKSRIELTDTHYLYGKDSIYFKVEMKGEIISTFGKWLPSSDWNEDFETSF